MKKACMVFLLLGMALKIHAQGCADAGFCSVGALQNGIHKEQDADMRNTAGFSVAVGSGEKQSWVITPQVEFKVVVSDKSYVEIKLPYQIVTGNLGTNMGIGDLLFTYTSAIKTTGKKTRFNYTLGSRIGTGSAADNKIGTPLPMAYQVSTGTTDIIAGISMNYGKHLVLAAGIQQPVLQYNQNGYYTTAQHDSSETTYFSSRMLRRKGDALLRIEVRKDWKKTGIHGGPLVLYHMGNDRQTDKAGNKISIPESAGFTFNLNFGFYYNAPKWIFDFTLAAPVHARENRPDGLTRSAVAIPRLTFRL